MKRFISPIRWCAERTYFQRYNGSVATTKKNVIRPITLNVIGSGAPGESPSVLLSVANKDTYLFNCGEDSHRLLIDQKKQIWIIKHIFATQTKWNCIGGISSVSRAIQQSQGILPLYHGPKSLYQSLKRILCLSIMSELDFKRTDCNSKMFFEDDTLRIQFLSINSDRADTINGRIRSNEVVVFLGRIKQQTENKMDNMRHSPNFLIIDLPSKEYIAALLKNYAKIIAETHFEIIVHYSSKELVESREYQNLIALLKTKKHLYLNESNEFSRLKSAYKLQMELNAIDEKVHPPLKMPLETSNADSDPKDDLLKFIPSYNLAGRHRNSDRVIEDWRGNVSFQQTVDLERSKLFPKIVFLGTVSAQASSIRNNTSILLHTTHKDSMLIDCGEGTCSQIFRRYGQMAPQIFTKIKAVFLSHLHYDHFGGLVEFLRIRKRYVPSNGPPLLVLASKADVKSWLYFYDTNIDAIHDDIFIIENENLSNGGLSHANCRKIGVDLLRTCQVPHFKMSHALTLNIREFKLTFSSDTPPCNDLITLGKNSTLVIHEATYPDHFVNKAIQNRHSTLSQAIEQCNKMNAKYAILTHFSNRQNIPIFDSSKHKNIGIAFDFMELTERDLPKLSKLTEKYQKLLRK